MNFIRATTLFRRPALHRAVSTLIAMAVGAIAWAGVTSVAHYRAEQNAPAIAVVAMLDTEQALTNLNDNATPESAVRAAASLNQATWVMKRPANGGVSEVSTGATSFVHEASAVDLTALLGYPDEKCPRGEAVSCWTYSASSLGVYPSQAVTDRMVLEIRRRGIREKLHTALVDAQMASVNSQRFGWGYEKTHPVLAWVDSAALSIVSVLHLA